MIRVAIAKGIDPLMAIRMGSYNTARHFGLGKYGAVAPGRYADLLIVPRSAGLQAGASLSRAAFWSRKTAP